ncbi:hypothetical protein HDU79_003376 [Rhizoclosmatium sp. JEL0117]|nr:hypothetical protein HDU79_003376 [Rhizoclosmatium sp. JEL0117]
MSESVLQTRWPRELIHHVFRYIHPGSVLKYSRLCRWMRICLSDPHFASLNLQCFDETSIDFDQLWLHWPPAYQEGYARKRQKHLQEEALRNMGCSFNFDVRWTVQTIDSVSIPQAIGFFEDLTHLTLENTFGFIGVIPDGVAALQSLRLLSISKMLDPQPFPIGICQLTNLTHLSLVHCSLMGTLPVEITKLTSLVSLNIGHNALYGTLPSDIGQLLRLHNLSLEDNQFSGPLPASLFDLAELEVLILDSNKFTGSDTLSDPITMMATGGVKSYNHVYPTTVKIESYTNSDEFELIECEKDMRGRDLKKKIEKHLDLSGDYKIFAVETKPSSSLPELVDEDNVKDICEKFSTYHLEVSGNLPVASGIRQRLGSNAALVREQVKIITRIDDEYDVMISYSWGTKDQVNDLYNALLDTFPGIKIWIDKERIQTDIFDGMTEGIVSSAVIIVCLSVPYLKSTNCQREIKYAGDLNRPLIPAYMFGPNDNVAEFRKDKKLGVPFFLTAGTLYADFKSERAGSPEWDGAFQVIVGQIRAKLPKFSPFSIENFKLPSMINLPEESKSSSRELLKLWLKPVDFRSTLEYFHGAFVDGTCKQMFDIILEWALSDDDSLIMWLNSGHGTGKSFFAWYLSQHLPDHLFIRGIYFFCSHDDYRRNNPASIIQTLVWMLSEQLPAIRNHIAAEMNVDATRLESSILSNPYKCFEALIIEGFKICEDPNRIVLVVIDGLDECDSKTRHMLLTKFCDLIPKLPKYVKFVVTSRPEKDVFDGLQNTDLFELPPKPKSESVARVALEETLFDYAKTTALNVKLFLENRCLDIWDVEGMHIVKALENKLNEKASFFLTAQLLFNHLSNQNATVQESEVIIESVEFHVGNIFTMILEAAEVEETILINVLGVLFFAREPVDIKTLSYLSDTSLRETLCCLDKVKVKLF